MSFFSKLFYSDQNRTYKQPVLFQFIPFALGVCLFAQSLAAQADARFVSSNSTTANPVSDVIQTGSQMESKGLWGDALTLYERAIRQHGDSVEIEKKLSNARTHYDVQRRDSDSGYRKSVLSTRPATAVNILGEVLLKIETHYVDQPEWVSLARQGLANLDVALYDEGFRRNHLGDIEDAKINYAYQHIHQLAQQYRVGNRRNVIDFSTAIANALEADLNLPRQVTLFEFINAATLSLDPYSSFLTSEQFADVMSQIDGNFVGLGVEIRPTKETLQIISVIPNGPAAKSGLLDGDLVKSVDGQIVSQIGGDAAADLLKGPAGSMVALEILRQGKTLPFRIFRQRVEIPSVQNVSIVDVQNRVGLIKLVNFQKNTAQVFEKSLWQLHQQGMRSLIIDLRGNPGGLLTAAVDVADLFVHRGVLVSTKGRNPREDFIHQARQNGTWQNLPVTVLIDHDSASASEILAGALSDQQRATVVGETSYGKGSVQGIFPLGASGGGLRLTTAKFYSPSGQAISNHGVKPHVQVQTTLRPTFDLVSDQEKVESAQPNEDSAMKAAIKVAIGKLQRAAG